MSTIYNFHQDITTSIAVASADVNDLLLIFDTSTGRTSYGTGAVLQRMVNGAATGSLVGFYGVTSITQPTSGNQAAVTSTAVSSTVTSTTPFGFASSTILQSLIGAVNSLTVWQNQMRTDLVALGLIKGS